MAKDIQKKEKAVSQLAEAKQAEEAFSIAAHTKTSLLFRDLSLNPAERAANLEKIQAVKNYKQALAKGCIAGECQQAEAKLLAAATELTKVKGAIKAAAVSDGWLAKKVEGVVEKQKKGHLETARRKQQQLERMGAMFSVEEKAGKKAIKVDLKYVDEGNKKLAGKSAIDFKLALKSGDLETGLVKTIEETGKLQVPASLDDALASGQRVMSESSLQHTTGVSGALPPVHETARPVAQIDNYDSQVVAAAEEIVETDITRVLTSRKLKPTAEESSVLVRRELAMEAGDLAGSRMWDYEFLKLQRKKLGDEGLLKPKMKGLLV